VIRAPKTWRGLLRRRVRVMVGTTQATRAGVASHEARTSSKDLVQIVRARPALLPSVVVFAFTSVVAKARARRQVSRGDFETWHRDDSTRGTA
jgi:hypothetical protein